VIFVAAVVLISTIPSDRKATTTFPTENMHTYDHHLSMSQHNHSTHMSKNPLLDKKCPTEKSSSSVTIKTVSSMLESHTAVTDGGDARWNILAWLAKNDGGRVAAVDTYGLLQRFVLALLYSSMHGWDHNDGWQTGDTVCNWEGVGCGEDCATVNVLDLSMMKNLKGNIPEYIGYLTALTSLLMNSNSLSGNIPSKIGSLTALRELSFWGNKLTGSIPSEIGSLTALAELSLWGNKLAGSIPTELSLLTSLTMLTVARNKLTGTISNTIGSLTVLNTLDVCNNNLSGTIPADIGSLTALTQLFVFNNKLSGNIPSEVGSLTSLLDIYMYGNMLDGKIPSEIGPSSSIEVLFLSNNYLKGGIPSELGMLTALRELYLDTNNLTGSIPEELKTIAKSLEFCNLGEHYGGNANLKGIPRNCG